MAPTNKKIGINLLKQDTQNLKKYRLLTRASLGFLGVYISALLLVFAYTLFLSYQKNSLTRRHDELAELVQKQSQKEGLLQTLKSRLDISKLIISKSSPSASELADNVIAILPTDVNLINLVSDKDGNTVLVIESPESLGIVHLFSVLEDKKFAGVLLDALSLNQDGQYVISLTLKQ